MKRVAKFILLIFVGLFLLNFFGKGHELNTSLKSTISSKPNLKETVEEAMAGAKGRYGIYIKNLKEGESYFAREQETFEAGSLYKLWVMGAIFKKLHSGELDEDKSIEADIEDLNREFGIAENDAELKTGHLQFTVKSALQQMITISHNYAALMLAREVGKKTLEEFLKEYGFNQSRLNPPETTPFDIGKLFEKLYKGEIVDAQSSGKMIELLREQKINDRIPKLLPEEVKVVHKTGDIGYFEHDGGIVSSGLGDYIIVVLSESDSPEAAGERIADLSLAVFKYFSQ